MTSSYVTFWLHVKTYLNKNCTLIKVLMDWRIFSSTFITIFIAEMGDKTQFAALAASAQTKSTLSVALAVVLGLSFAGILGVAFGKVIGEYLSPAFMKWISGSIFIAMGAWILTSKP